MGVCQWTVVCMDTDTDTVMDMAVSGKGERTIGN